MAEQRSTGRKLRKLQQSFQPLLIMEQLGAGSFDLDMDLEGIWDVWAPLWQHESPVLPMFE